MKTVDQNCVTSLLHLNTYSFLCQEKPRVEYRFPKYCFLKVNQKLAKTSSNRLNTFTAARVNRDCSAKLID